MKRTLSLLVALALVFTMIPAVFAADNNEDIGMDELTQGMEIDNPTPAEIGKPYTTTWLTFTSKEGGEAHGVHYFEITADEAGNLELTVDANGTVALEGVTANDDGTYPVEAGEKYIVVVTKDAEATEESTWSATYIAPHVHAAATYTNNGDGTHKVTCECGEVVTASEDHTFVDGTCVCGAVEVPPCDHAEKKYTDNGNGTHKVTCPNCEEFEPVDEAHADTDSNGKCDSCDAELVLTDPNLVFYRFNTSGGDLILGDDVRASFTVQNKSGYASIYVEVTKDNVTTTADELSTSTASTYKCSYVVPAAHMTMDLKVVVYGVKNGVTYRGEELTYSIRKCADAKLASWINNPAAAGQCKLIMNMLYYGERTQLQFNVNTDKLATAGMDQKYLDLINKDSASMSAYPTIDVTGKKATIRSMSLMLQEKVKLSTILDFPNGVVNGGADYRIEIKHTRSKDGVVVPYTIYPADFAQVTTKQIKFYFDKMAPSQLRDDLEIIVYQGDEAISATYVRSMEMVVQSYTGNAALLPLLNAIMNYADAAKAVFG